MLAYKELLISQLFLLIISEHKQILDIVTEYRFIDDLCLQIKDWIQSKGTGTVYVDLYSPQRRVADPIISNEKVSILPKTQLPEWSPFREEVKRHPIRLPGALLFLLRTTAQMAGRRGRAWTPTLLQKASQGSLGKNLLLKNQIFSSKRAYRFVCQDKHWLFQILCEWAALQHENIVSVETAA